MRRQVRGWKAAQGDSVVERTAQVMVQKLAPQLLVPQEPRYRALWEDLAVLFALEPPVRSLMTYRSRVGPRPYLPIRSLFSSVLLHFSLAFFLFRVPLHFLLKHVAPENHPAQIVYPLRLMDLSEYLPGLRPQGSKGSPGRGTRPEQSLARGTAFDPRLTLISDTPNPDNSRQTIVQSSSPPDLKIPFELRLPNVVAGNATSVPKPPEEFHLDAPVSAPVVPSVPSNFPLALPPSPNLLPSLEVPMPPFPASSEPLKAADPTVIADLGFPGSASADVKALLSLNVDPAPLTDLITLSPGNRYGNFSVLPVVGEPTSPWGVANGDPREGTGGVSTSGIESSGAASGGSGRGDNGSDVGETPNVGDGAPSVADGGALPSFFPASLVYPVLSPLRPRHSALIISAGPVGGGGLRVYGVLRGGKIYTIYLHMPGKNWILEYCGLDNTSPQRASPSQGTVVRLDPALVPPSAEEEFDFHRPPVPKDKAEEMIILHGVIRDDGAVDELEVFQGFQVVADQAALAAFGRWKFKPALRAGKPVTVEILVGIPATVRETSETRAAN